MSIETDVEVVELNPFELDPKFVEELWDRVKDIEEAFDDRLRGRGDLFVNSFFNGTHFYLLGNFGIATAANAVQGGDANVHFTIWNGERPFEVVSACRIALEKIFNQFELVRATSTVGEHNDNAIRVARLLGFKVEGRLRKANLFHGQLHDSLVLGILREEILPTEN